MEQQTLPMSTSGLLRWPFLVFTIAFAVCATANAAPLSQRPAAINFPEFPAFQRQNLAPVSLLPPCVAMYGSSAAAFSECHRPFLAASERASTDSSRTQDSAGQIAAPPKSPVAEHHFWDRENDLLFAWVGASRALDYASTLNFRRRGVNEVFLTNDIVDNHAAFAAIEAGGVAASIGVSYLFHHYHHHSLERWTSIVHASIATGGAIRNYSLKSAH